MPKELYCERIAFVIVCSQVKQTKAVRINRQHLEASRSWRRRMGKQFHSLQQSIREYLERRQPTQQDKGAQ